MPNMLNSTLLWFTAIHGNTQVSKRCKTNRIHQSHIKNNVIKALTILSKYIGQHAQFKSELKNYGIHSRKQSSIESFLRILKANNSDILVWYSKAIKVLRPDEQLYLRFSKITGIRKQEAINSFNRIIDLAIENRIAEYYDSELSVLMHFKYPELFLRRTKNCYISFVPKDLVNEIANSQEVTYAMIRKRLNRQGLKVRINELRDYFGTYLRKHNVTKEEIDLLQGCIASEILIRHYWSPKLKELGIRIFQALKNMDTI